MNALNVPDWWEETEKKGFNKCLDNKVHDALWNSKVILEKYGREYRPNDAGFEEVVLKADLFRSRCAPFAKNHNRIGSIAWWKSNDGVVEA